MTGQERAHAAQCFKRDILGRYIERRMAPLVDRVFPFDELPAAKVHMESNAMTGKVVVKID
jgi:NADPH:quinone reductase-like Zn-dependent oxidoreductase